MCGSKRAPPGPLERVERLSLRTLRTACVASVALLWAAAGLTAAQAGAGLDFVVVVHAGNTLESIDRDALRRIFLKQSRSWPGGGEALPVDQSAASGVREAFSKGVLRQPQAAINAYWQRQILAGRANPPPVKPNDVEILAFVGSDVRAVGYVAAGTALPAGVKRLELTEPDEGEPGSGPGGGDLSGLR